MRLRYILAIVYVTTMLSAQASQDVTSPLSSQDVSEFYAKYLDRVDDVNLLLDYTKVEKVEEGILVRTTLRGKVVFVGKSELLGRVGTTKT